MKLGKNGVGPRYVKPIGEECTQTEYDVRGEVDKIYFILPDYHALHGNHLVTAPQSSYGS
jgi:hypothetical protein